MSKRKQTPSNLMEDLLSGAKKQRDVDRTESQDTGKPVEQQPGKTSEEKGKATYYIDQEILYSLDAAQLRLRRLASPDQRGHISKSAIVETALQIVLEELESDVANSRLLSALVTE